MFFDKEETKKSIKFFNVFEDENGLLKDKTKISLRDSTINFRCTVVLKPAHSFVQCIIEDCHLESNQ